MMRSCGVATINRVGNGWNRRVRRVALGIRWLPSAAFGGGRVSPEFRWHWECRSLVISASAGVPDLCDLSKSRAPYADLGQGP
eukprot:scaffold112291_cov43-Cyclotella_meneghiniana.AAC.2